AGCRMQQGLRRAHRHHVADQCCEPGRTVILAGQSHRDAHGKQQSQIRKHGLAGRGHGDPVQQIRLPETQHQTGDGQYRNRQHQGASELLKSSETKIHLAFPPSPANRSTMLRTSAAEPKARQLCASSSQSAMRNEPIWLLSAGIAAGTTDSSRTPNPSKIGTAVWSAATPPQTATSLPAALAWLAAATISCNTAGCNASVRSGKAMGVRSMASVYWVISLRPGASRSWIQARYGPAN